MYFAFLPVTIDECSLFLSPPTQTPSPPHYGGTSHYKFPPLLFYSFFSLTGTVSSVCQHAVFLSVKDRENRTFSWLCVYHQLSPPFLTSLYSGDIHKNFFPFFSSPLFILVAFYSNLLSTIHKNLKNSTTNFHMSYSQTFVSTLLFYYLSIHIYTQTHTHTLCFF